MSGQAKVTISFKCPHCNALVGFDQLHAGKRAKCLSCQQRFIIPSKAGEKAIKIAAEKEKPGKPIPGFYKAALIDTWTNIWSSATLSLLIWIVIGVSGRFGAWMIGSSVARNLTLSGGGDWVMGFGAAFKAAIEYGIVVCCLVTAAMLWGRMWDWYISISSITAVETDQFINPMEMGTLMFWYHSLKPFIFTCLIVIAAGLPFLLGLVVFDWVGIEYNLLSFEYSPQIVLQVLLLISVLLFPSVFISLAINRDVDTLNPANIFPPIFKRFIPYIFIAAGLAAVLYLDFKLTFVDLYNNNSVETIRNNFLAVMGLQFCMVILMRWLGLFYRHYSCFFKY